jgi:putative intracellular protease/amidase
MSTPSQPRVRVAILLEAVQLSDIIGIDILGNLSTAFVKQAASVSPAHAVFVPLSIPFEFFYVASTLDPTSTTPQNFRYLPTVTYDTCPRDLDIVIMGGPFLDHRPEAATRFMQEAWGRTRTWMTVCTGSMWLASVGVLDGKRATTNRMMLGVARGMHPGVEWMDERWTVGAKEYDGGRGEGEGELWTAGGAGCGELFFYTFLLCPLLLSCMMPRG